jgi:hypothetical protein
VEGRPMLLLKTDGPSTGKIEEHGPSIICNLIFLL